MNKKRVFLVKTTDFLHDRRPRVGGEEGEEKHPPVGKEINRPKCPNNSPPCREVFDSCCTRKLLSFLS